MEGFWKGVLSNQVLWITILSWAIAQGIKILRGLIQGQKFNFYWNKKTS